MKDVFHFQSPVGVLGRFADAVFMKKYLTRFLKERNQLIKEFAETGRGIAMLEATKNLNFKEQAGVFSFTDEGFVLQENRSVPIISGQLLKLLLLIKKTG